jgi:hypothetical protein
MDINLDPQVFRDAAEIVRQYRVGCCYAITSACGWDAVRTDVYLDFVMVFFKPKQVSLDEFWWLEGETEPRLIALLLCADILESEQKAQRSRKR